MRPLTPRYRRRLAAVWSIQAAVIVWNLIRPSFAAMAVPMLALWLYTIACMAREGSAFPRLFALRYPGRFREWTDSRPIWQFRRRDASCPAPEDPELSEHWSQLQSAQRFALRVFAGFVMLFAALLIRMVLLGPYEST